MPHLHEPILQFFAVDNPAANMQEIARLFWQLAFELVSRCPNNPERAIALHKLLEAKDATIRAVLFQEAKEPG
jgi:hypothetical protein